MRARAGEMGVRDRAGERVGGIGGFEMHRGKQAPHHGLHLRLVGMADADHGFLDVVGRIFGDFQPRLRRGQKRNRARVPQFQRRQRVFGDEGLLDGHRMGRMLRQNRADALMQRRQTFPQAMRCRGDDDAIGDMGELGARDFDHAPAGARKPRIESGNADNGQSVSPARIACASVGHAGALHATLTPPRASP